MLYDYTIKARYNKEYLEKEENTNTYVMIRVSADCGSPIKMEWARFSYDWDSDKPFHYESGVNEIENDEFWGLNLEYFEQCYVAFFNYFVAYIWDAHLNFEEITFFNNKAE